MSDRTNALEICKFLIYILLITIIYIMVFDIAVDLPRNDRFPIWKIATETYPDNPYEKTYRDFHPDTGMLSIILAKVFDYKWIIFIMWIIILSISFNKVKWNIIDIILILLIAFISIREMYYMHDELYIGLPFVYFSYKSENRIIAGLFMALAFTIRPFYIIFALPYAKSEMKWATSFMAFLFLFVLFNYFAINKESIQTYNYILNNFNNNVMGTFKGEGVPGYKLWLLDYILLVLFPILWFKGKRDTVEDYFEQKRKRYGKSPELEFEDNY